MTTVIINNQPQTVTQQELYHLTLDLQAKGYDMRVVQNLGCEDVVHFTAPELEETILDPRIDSKKFLVIKKIGDRIEAYLEGHIFLAWNDEISARIALLRLQFNGYDHYWNA